MSDLRQAFRNLRRQPGFAAVAVLTLAFGIGVNVSVFSIINAFFLQPLPVSEARQLVLIMQRSDVVNFPYGYSYPDYRNYRETTSTLSDLAAYTPMPVHLGVRGQTPERTWIEVVSPNYFSLARVRPAFGEFPPPDAETKGTAPTVVLSYRYWQRRFGGNPSLVGRPIIINGKSFTVIGIAPATFTGLSWAMAVSAFVPAGALGTLMDGGDAFRENRGSSAFRLMGRLGPGKTIADARAELGVAAERLARSYPAEHKNAQVVVIPENRARPDPTVSAILPIFAAVFSGMVAFILLIACANVANLMLSRAVTRQRDLVIRSALGASRLRLIRLQVTESLVLASLAGVCAMFLAYASGRALAGLMSPGDIPVNTRHPWEWQVYAFTLCISFVAGIVTGLSPARKATCFDLVESLKDGGSVVGPSRHALRNTLVVGQVTLSLVVLVSAGLFLQSLRRVQTIALGFKPDGLLMLSVDLGLQQYSDTRGRRFLDDLLMRAASLPGVTSATAATSVPFDYAGRFADVTLDKPIPGTTDGSIHAAYTNVAPKYFETTHTSLVRGRTFDRRDDEQSRRVGIVNETMARQLWPAADAMGQRFRFGRTGEWIEVVGIAHDGKYLMVGEAPRAFFYLPLVQQYRSPIILMVRSASDPAALATALQQTVNRMDPDLPIFNVRTMSRHLRDSVFGFMPMRMGAMMAGVQGVIGALLALMGLYAVVAHSVARRTREIGVRRALGADRGDVLRLVVREGMWLSLLGVAIGLVLAIGIGFLLSKILYGLAPVDVGVLAMVTMMLVGVSALACIVPARRAIAVDPIVALRYE
ncbi:MAG: ABC transporter permease [Acidobacteriota bacterium]